VNGLEPGVAEPRQARYATTMTGSSRIPGFYKLPLLERRREIAERAELNLETLQQVVDSGGIGPDQADKLVENVLGVYGLPFGVALNFTVNGRDRLAPMVVEEPSVIAAASNAARMIRAAGGFTAEMVEDLMTTQIQLSEVADPVRATQRLEEAREELLELGRSAVPNLLARGGGPRQLEVRQLGQGMMALHVHVDCRDAMGANLVNTIAEAIGPRAAVLAEAKLGLRILTNLCDRRRVRVRARIHADDLRMGRPHHARTSWAPEADSSGAGILDAIVSASRFAEVDPYRAATHNKGIMNGIDSVVIATGDYRAVEAGAHAYAARSGQYSPLAIWRREADDLVGELELPLALGIVGGTLRVHPAARLALQISSSRSAAELATLAASVGLASNLAAIRALATEGIQRGHMSLHARSVASAAGALGPEVEFIAAQLCAEGRITVDFAASLLQRLRGES
jgi:hydroxymethylglutaryl-CoA reductase